MSRSVRRAIGYVATYLAVVVGTARHAHADLDRIDEFLSFGAPLDAWIAAHGHTGTPKEAQLALARAESARCSAAAAPSEACAKLDEALSLVLRVQHYRGSRWQCQANLEGGDKVVADGEVPSWLIEGLDAFSLFNLSDEGGRYTEKGWGRVAIKVYGASTDIPLDALEIQRTPKTPWGSLRHHASLDPASSRRLHRAFIRGAEVVTSSFDVAGKPIKTVKTPLRGYAQTMKLCGLE